MAQVSPRELLKQSLANYDRDWHASMNCSYTQRDVEKSSAGTKVSVSQVTVIDSFPYEKVISRNGKPLSADEARKEEEKYQKALKASTSDREKRVAEAERKRDFLKEAPDAFDAKLLGEEPLAGRPNYVIHLTPKPGYEAKSSHAKMFSKLEAKLWIDKEDMRWTKAEAHVIDTIAIGFFLARIGPGANILMEQEPIGDNIWLPKKIDVSGNAKILMMHNKSIDEELTYSNYHNGKPQVQAVTAGVR